MHGSVNERGLPKIGPHGVDLSKPRGVTRSRLLNRSDDVARRLKAEVEAQARAERAYIGQVAR